MDTDQSAPAVSVEAEARNLGWVPQEDFRGDTSRWVDAETFVERGHTIMPILKKTNERLDGTVRQQAEEIARLKTLFNASQESIQELQNVHKDATRAAVEKARKDVMAELKDAKQSGDIDREMALTEELADLKVQQATADAAKPAKVQLAAPTPETPHPDFPAWMEENKWFGVDQRKTLRAMGIAQELRAEPEYDSLQGKPFFDKIMSVMDERSGGPRTSKVAEPRGSGGGGGQAGKRAFNDLPPDAKETCDRQGRKLVGEGRAFKDMGAWRQYYTNLYYSE